MTGGHRTIGGEEAHIANLRNAKILRSLKQEKFIWRVKVYLLLLCTVLWIFVLNEVPFGSSWGAYFERLWWAVIDAKNAVASSRFWNGFYDRVTSGINWRSMDAAMVGSFVTLIIFLFFGLRDFPGIHCDTCSLNSKITDQWVCGHCRKSGNRGLFPLQLLGFQPRWRSWVRPCFRCKELSPAIACRHCGEHILVDPANYDPEKVAYFKEGALPVKKAPAD